MLQSFLVRQKPNISPENAKTDIAATVLHSEAVKAKISLTDNENEDVPQDYEENDIPTSYPGRIFGNAERQQYIRDYI